jgi:tetratricopeptide (TPR) repeat protein
MSQFTLEFASRSHGLGHLDRAEGFFRSIPAGAPQYPDAVAGLAVIAYERGRHREAVVYFSRLLALRPDDAANHCNLGECLRECGRLDEALTQLKLGIALDPDQPDAFNSLGLTHHAQRRLEPAEEAFRWALRLRPEFPMAMINLGMALQEQRRLKEAAELFRRALSLDPDNPMGNSNLGQILLELGRIDDLDEAERCCLRAIQMTPDRPHPINNLGNVYRAMGRYEEALDCYQKAMVLAPAMAMPLNNMGQAMQGRARYAEAVEYYMSALALEPNVPRFHANYASLFHDQDCHEAALGRYRHALALDPDHAESYCGMGQVYLRVERATEAEAMFRKALEIDPELTAPRLGLSNLYSELGDFEKAEAEAEIALRSHPKLIEVYYQLSTHRKGKVSDHELETMTALLGEKYLGDGARSQLNFALGAVHDHRANHELSGHCFQVANDSQAAARLKRNETYEPGHFTDWIDKVIGGFSADLLARLGGTGHPSRRPIFVVGLPRSGTTLTEQILASHSAIHGAGELTFMNKTFQDLPCLLANAGSEPFSALQSVDSFGLKASAESYLAEIAARNSEASFVVDKMPDNVNILGWIHLLFPNARVIHCRRDLRDVALSCWQTCFGSIRWANDWGQIARRLIDNLRVVEHWKRLERIEWLDFPYESVIGDPEGYARRLIEYLGLEWEPNCLRFHETRRQVRTASLSQVREPIYRTSVAKWRNYEREMAPFLDEMARLGWNGSA